MPPRQHRIWKAIGKRTFDVLAASAGLTLLAPALLTVSAAIALDSPGGILYRGRRVGRLGRPFSMLKFRTMIADADKRGASSTPSNDPRITRLGALLRRYKVDELPQLINVLRGEMSVIGPRPQVEWAVDLYTPEQRATLLSVRPGLTDYASIRFRNESEILRGASDPDKAYLELIAPEKIKLGMQYVDEQSLWTDCKIIARTLMSIIT